MRSKISFGIVLALFLLVISLVSVSAIEDTFFLSASYNGNKIAQSQYVEVEFTGSAIVLPSVSIEILPSNSPVSATLPANILTNFFVTCLSTACKNITYNLVLDDSFSIDSALYYTKDDANTIIDFGTLDQSTNLSILDNESLDLIYEVNSAFGVLNRSVYVEAFYNDNFLNRSDILDMSFITLGPSCYDGISNQDETGVDCGGICGGTCYDTCPRLLGDACENGGKPIGLCSLLDDFGTSDYPLDGNYCLRDNLYCENSVNSGISDTKPPFTGEFDGRGCTIEGFNGKPLFDKVGVKDTGSRYEGAVIKNINFVNASVSDSSYAGIVAGEFVDAASAPYVPAEFTNINFTNSSVSSTSSHAGMLIGAATWLSNDIGFEHSIISYITINGGSVSGRSNVGGLAGYTSGSNIDSVYSSASVTAVNSNAGGIIGEVYLAGQLSNMASVGDVAGGRYVGGIIGLANADSSGDIDLIDSYATGDVTDSNGLSDISISDIGGIVGRTVGDVKLINTWSSGTVSGPGTGVGGLLGTIQHIYPERTVTDSYYDSQTSGQSDNDDRGTPRTTVQMGQQSTYEPEWDFINTWKLVPGADYPCLQWQTTQECLANNN